MAISMPTDVIGIANIELSAVTAISMSQSPFTFKQQVFAWPGQRWEAKVKIPTILRDLAEPWAVFLLKCNGPENNFLLGDPNGTSPQGTVSSSTTINGANQSGDSITVSSISGTLKAGDYLQIETGDDARLYKVLDDVSDGGTSINIWPSLTKTPPDGAAVSFTDTVGNFRLRNNKNSWSIDEISKYGLEFEAVQVIP